MGANFRIYSSGRSQSRRSLGREKATKKEYKTWSHAATNYAHSSTDLDLSAAHPEALVAGQRLLFEVDARRLVAGESDQQALLIRA